MTPSELREGFHALAMKLYSDEFTRWRREAFRQYLRGPVEQSPLNA
jgi:hypothetical protein